LLAAQPAVLVLDLAMAHMDGIEVIRQLAAARFTGRLVIVSGHSAAMLQSAKLLAELQDVRVAGVLTKPIRAESLLALLRAPELRAATPQVRLSDGAWVGLEALMR